MHSVFAASLPNTHDWLGCVISSTLRPDLSSSVLIRSEEVVFPEPSMPSTTYQVIDHSPMSTAAPAVSSGMNMLSYSPGHTVSMTAVINPIIGASSHRGTDGS